MLQISKKQVEQFVTHLKEQAEHFCASEKQLKSCTSADEQVLSSIQKQCKLAGQSGDFANMVERIEALGARLMKQDSRLPLAGASLGRWLARPFSEHYKNGVMDKT